MKKEYQFNLNTVPVSDQRPRTNYVTRRIYDNRKTEKNIAKILILQQMREFSILKLMSGCLYVKIDCYTKIPKSLSKARKKVLSEERTFDKRRPDADNYTKFYFDVMNKLIYEDDSQIVSYSCKKKYSPNPRVKILIREIDEQEQN